MLRSIRNVKLLKCVSLICLSPLFVFYSSLNYDGPRTKAFMIKNSNCFFFFFLPTFKVLKNEIILKMIIFSSWRFICFKSYFLRRVTPLLFFPLIIFFIQLGLINSSPGSSHFVHHKRSNWFFFYLLLKF